MIRPPRVVQLLHKLYLLSLVRFKAELSQSNVFTQFDVSLVFGHLDTLVHLQQLLIIVRPELLALVSSVLFKATRCDD